MGEAMTEGIVVRRLDVSRGARRVLRGVEAEVPPGAITGVLGPNGAGKSTLLMAVAGLLPFEGAIELDGRDLRGFKAFDRARRLAYVPQRSGLSAPFPVASVVGQGRFPHHGPLASPRRIDREAVERAMARADVTAIADRPFDALSGGEQRRVLIARALATEARTIVLDEPTASLDVGHALALHALLRELADEGYAIAVVLHHLDDARERTDRAVLLDAGRVAAAGPSREVVAAERVRAVYGVELVEGGGLGFRLPEVR
jgi:iron complex transport system ATP-binding protein